MSFHWPGHNYLGPGTYDFTKQPIDSDDQIAERHDRAYLAAKDHRDIRRADREAILAFGRDTISKRNVHSAIGALGIGLKYGLETATGVIYPRMPPTGKRANDNNDEGYDSPMKAARQELSGTPNNDTRVATTSTDTSSGSANTAMATQQSPQAGSSLPGGTGSSIMATIIKNPRMHGQSVTIRKQHQLYTGGYVFSVKDTSFLPELHYPNATTFEATISRFYVTPLAAINASHLPLFLTRAEYNELPRGAYAASCRIKVTPLGYRLPFETNNPNAAFANSQTLVQIGYGVGLNNQINMVEAGYVTSADDLTMVTGLTEDEFDLEEILYGSALSVGCNMGIPRHWNNYTVLALYGEAGVSIRNPNLTRMMDIQNVNDCKGTPVINYEYNYKNGLLKHPYNANRMFSNNAAVGHPKLPEGIMPNLYAMRNLNEVDATQPNKNGRFIYRSANSATQPGNYLQLDYDMLIEKSSWLQNNTSHAITPDAPPLVHFGCMPVQANAALSPTPSWANAVIQWQVECELDIKYSYDFLSPNLPIVVHQKYDPQWAYNNSQTDFPSWRNRHWYFVNRPFYYTDQYTTDPILRGT